MTLPIAVTPRELVDLRSHLWSRFSRGTTDVSLDDVGPSQTHFFTFEERADLPHRGRPFSVVLAQSQLHVEQRHPSDDEEERVRDQKGTWRTQRQGVSP